VYRRQEKGFHAEARRRKGGAEVFPARRVAPFRLVRMRARSGQIACGARDSFPSRRPTRYSSESWNLTSFSGRCGGQGDSSFRWNDD
jgi:hypothetical protein